MLYRPTTALKCVSGFEEGSLFRNIPKFYTRNCENGFDFCYKEHKEEGCILIPTERKSKVIKGKHVARNVEYYSNEDMWSEAEDMVMQLKEYQQVKCETFRCKSHNWSQSGSISCTSRLAADFLHG